MNEPAQLTHSRNQAIVDAWGQCVALYVKEGDELRILYRCSGNRIEAHHATKRSAGGGHEPENILPWCSEHHRKVHEDPHVTGPFTDSAGRRFYREDVGPKDRIEKVRIYDFRDFQAELQDRFIENEQLMALGATYGVKGQHCLGFALEEADRLSLWQLADDLEADDADFHTYLNRRGMTIAHTTLAEKINVYATLRKKGIEFQHLLDAVDECAQVHKFPPGYAAIRANLPSLRRMEGPEIVGLLAGSPSSDFKAAISDHLENQANQKAIAEGNVRVTLSATLTVEIEHTFTSLGSTEADRKKLEGRIVSAIGKRGVAGSFRFKHHGEPVRVREEE